MIVELKCGSIWRLLGSDKVSLVGAGPVGVAFSEYAVAKPSAWEFIRPMLAENDGWAAFITTPRGHNHAKKLYDAAKAPGSGWFADVKTLYDTRAYDPEATIAEARASGMPEGLIRQEFLCDWTAANVGAIWGDLVESIEKRGGIDAFDHPADGVFTSWDLGFSDATAIWFWRIGERGIDVVDHYEAHGKPLSHFLDVLDEKGYRYVKHWLPHDARAKSLQTGASIIEQVTKRIDAGQVAITPQLDLLDGIQAARWLLQQPIRFHARCAQGIEALKAYHYGWDEDRRAFSTRPEHDWSSHTADAFRYVACAVRASDLLTRGERIDPKPAARPLESFALDEIWDTGPRAVSGRI